MSLTTPGASPIRVIVPQQPPVYTGGRYPFITGQQGIAKSAAAVSLYSAKVPAPGGAQRIRYTLAANLGAAELDIALGAAVTAAADASVDAAVDTGLAAPSDPASVLRVVVIRSLANAEATLRRRGTDVADGSLSAESFKVKTSSAGANVIRVRGPASGAWKAGEILDIFVLGTGDITTTALNANRDALVLLDEILYGAPGTGEEINVRAMLAS